MRSIAECALTSDEGRPEKKALPSWPVLLLICGVLVAASLGLAAIADDFAAVKESKRLENLAREIQVLPAREFALQLARSHGANQVIPLCQAWEDVHRADAPKEHLRVWMAAKDQWLTGAGPYTMSRPEMHYINEKISLYLDAALPETKGALDAEKASTLP